MADRTDLTNSASQQLGEQQTNGSWQQTASLGRPASLSDDELERAISSRCDQTIARKLISDLMGQHWVSGSAEDRARDEAIMAKDIAEFSNWVVASAIEDVRKNLVRKPTTAHIVAACRRFRQNAFVQKNHRAATMRPDTDSHTGGHSSATSEERKASFRRIADAVGYVEHNGEWLSQAHFSEKQAEEEAPRVPHWTEREETRELWRSHLERARASNPLMFPAKPVAD